MKKINWILQVNLTKEKVLDEIRKTLIHDGISFEEVKVIPFSDELPHIKNDEDYLVFYGSTTLILNAYNNSKYQKYVFYERAKFNVQNYLTQWGSRMLNADSEICTFSQIVNHYVNLNKHWFIRPIEDYKSFSGRLMSYLEIVDFEQSLANSNNPYLNQDTLVAISTPKTIEKEWRHFIIDKKIISSCRYSNSGHIDISAEDVPNNLLHFVEDCCNIYVPHDVFVMDTAEIAGEYRIVECNCFNDTGYYDHDITSIIQAVNRYLERQLEQFVS